MHVVEQKGIINSFEIFNIYSNKYGAKKWGVNVLERLYGIILQNPELEQIDKTVSNDKGPNGIIFQGHQKIKQITFFVLSSLSEDDKINKCQLELDNLFQNSINNQKCPRKSKKSGKKVDIPDDFNHSLVKSHSSTQFVSFLSPGFISSKVLRCQIMHHFLNDTFGSNSFTLQDIYDNMSIGLYFKILGSTNTPKVLINCPMLRFILLRCFPKSIRDEINFDESQKNLLSLLEKLKKEFYIINTLDDGKYLLRQYIVLSDLNVKIPIFFKNPHSIEIFWQFVEISNRMEHISNYSSDLWLKRWSIKDYFMNVKKEKSMICSIIQKVGYQYSRSIRQSANLVSKYGYDRILFANFLPSEPSEECEEDKLIDIYSQNFKWENPKIKNNLIYQKIDNENNIPTVFDEDFFLADLVAKSRVTIGGIIQNSEIKWRKILSLMISKESLTWQIVKNKFRFLYTKFQSIQSRFNHTVALTIALTFQNYLTNNHDEYLELSEEKILSHFNIINQQLILKNEIGELVECFKRFLLCPDKFYTVLQASKLFSEYIWSCSNESLLFLKISGFYNPKDQIGFKPSKPKPHTQIEKHIFKNIYFYEKLKQLSCTLQKAIIHPYNDVPLIPYDTSAFYYIIHQDIFVNTMNSHIIDFLLNTENDENRFSAIFFSFTSYIEQMNKIKKDLKVRFHCLPMPYLPELSLSNDLSSNVAPSEINKDDKKNNLKFNISINSLFSATPEFFLIVSQVKWFNNSGLSPFVRYSYGFILHSEYDGLDLNTLRKNFNLDFNEQLFDELLLSLEFLEEFHFIRKKHSSSALPIYVSDAFFLHEEKEYYWTTIYHQLDERLLIKQYSLVFEQIELNPGIEIFDLYVSIAYLSISDLLDIINVLIYDEAIYMTTSIFMNEGSLFDDTVLLPINNFSNDHLLVIFYLKQIDPSCTIPVIKLYPSSCGALKNQCFP